MNMSEHTKCLISRHFSLTKENPMQAPFSNTKQNVRMYKENREGNYLFLEVTVKVEK